MAFMEPQIEYGEWVEVETNIGTEIIPSDLVNVSAFPVEIMTEDDCLIAGQWDGYVNAVRDYIQGEPLSFRVVSGFGARLSAPVQHTTPAPPNRHDRQLHH